MKWLYLLIANIVFILLLFTLPEQVQTGMFELRNAERSHSKVLKINNTPGEILATNGKGMLLPIVGIIMPENIF